MIVSTQKHNSLTSSVKRSLDSQKFRVEIFWLTSFTFAWPEIGKELTDSKQLNHFSWFCFESWIKNRPFLDFDSNQRIENQLFWLLVSNRWIKNQLFCVTVSNQWIKNQLFWVFDSNQWIKNHFFVSLIRNVNHDPTDSLILCQSLLYW